MRYIHTVEMSVGEFRDAIAEYIEERLSPMHRIGYPIVLKFGGLNLDDKTQVFEVEIE